MVQTTNKRPGTIGFLVLLGLAIVISVWQTMYSSVLYALHLGTHVDKPATYEFPEMAVLAEKYSHEGRLDYASLRATPRLNEAMRKLSQTSAADLKDPKDRLAYWINASNLLTIKEIADRYPVNTLQEMQNDFTSKRFLVGGVYYTLRDMNVRCVYPTIMDVAPKAIFLVCGGSLGYPAFPDHAILGRTLDADCENGALAFIDNPKNVAFSKEKRSVFLSPFFQWNAKFLQENYGSPEDFISAYLKPSEAQNFTSPIVLKKYNLPFDWRVNDISVQN
jgi:hypothetical protein